MKWLLIYTAIAQAGQTTDRLEFETKELCEQRAIGLLEFSEKIGLRTRAVCQNPETGESFEVKLPKRTTA